MNKYLPPQSLGLPPRTLVKEVDKNTIAIEINRKSRLIMADGRKIFAKAEKIMRIKPGNKIILETTAPICSKTLQFLADQGIEVIKS